MPCRSPTGGTCRNLTEAARADPGEAGGAHPEGRSWSHHRACVCGAGSGSPSFTDTPGAGGAASAPARALRGGGASAAAGMDAPGDRAGGRPRRPNPPAVARRRRFPRTEGAGSNAEQTGSVSSVPGGASTRGVHERGAAVAGVAGAGGRWGPEHRRHLCPWAPAGCTASGSTDEEATSLAPA